MPATLLRRLSSSLVDFVLIILVVYGIFYFGGQSYLRNRIDNYYILDADYTEIMEVYSSDIDEIGSEYDAAITLAGEDEDLKAEALEIYQTKHSILDSQNGLDIVPYNTPLTNYILSSIYFFVIAFVALSAVLAVVTLGRTPGRRLLNIELMRINENDELIKPGVFGVFLHDSVFKYLIVGVLLVYNLTLGLLVMLLGLLTDIVLITFTRNGSTIRDLVTRIKVFK